MSTETRDTLLHGQLQEGLKYDVMRAPSVSGAQGCKELCLAAKNEEKRLAELKKYLRPTILVSQHPSSRKPVLNKPPEIQPSSKPQKTGTEPTRYYLCNKTGHLARDCQAPRTVSGGRTGERKGKHVNAKQVRTAQEGGQQSSQQTHHQREDPLPFLYSSESEDGEDVRRVRVNDKGSCPQLAGVEIQGVPAQGITDSGADISIMGGELFKRIAAVARLKRRDFKRADKVPCTYDQKPFPLDGRLDLDVSFGDKTMKTAIYIKMDAHDQLLLSEGVCRQLGIISYHPDVQAGQSKESPSTGAAGASTSEDDAIVPTVRVRLLQSAHLPPQQSSS